MPLSARQTTTSIMRPIALTIAGSDSSGGAGIQADLKTFGAFGVYGASVITALTAQNTIGVQAVYAVPPEFVAEQLSSVLGDLDVRAIKTGMLANAANILAVAAKLHQHEALRLVVDPVMIATTGAILLEPDAVNAMCEQLFPRADIVTPNLDEAAQLLLTAPAESPDDMVDQARAIAGRGARAVLLKGGHSDASEAADVLVSAGEVTWFSVPRIATTNTHGTGCTLAAAITAGLARGADLPRAVSEAKQYLTKAIEAGRDLGVGAGHGPVDHLADTGPSAG